MQAVVVRVWVLKRKVENGGGCSWVVAEFYGDWAMVSTVVILQIDGGRLLLMKGSHGYIVGGGFPTAATFQFFLVHLNLVGAL